MIYKFRAECQPDVDALTTLLGDKLINLQAAIEDPAHPDLVCTIEVVPTLTLESLKNTMAKVEDGYIMYETVALTDQYTGERNFEHRYV